MLFTLDIILLLMGLFIIIRENNLIKKVIGLNIFQASVFIFYLIISKAKDGVPPILTLPEADTYNPGLLAAVLNIKSIGSLL